VKKHRVLRCIVKKHRVLWSIVEKQLLCTIWPIWVLLVCLAGGQYTCTDFDLPGAWMTHTFGLAATDGRLYGAHDTPPSSPRPLLAFTDIADSDDESNQELDASSSESEESGAAWSFGSSHYISADEEWTGCETHRTTASLSPSTDEDAAVAADRAHAALARESAPQPFVRTVREYRDLRAPVTTSGRGILSFFAKTTPADVELRRKAAAEMDRETLIEAREKADEKNAMKLQLRRELKREQARNRKRRQRERVKEVKAAAATPQVRRLLTGSTNQSTCSMLSCVQIVHDVLRAENNKLADIAELSRPYRLFKEAARAGRGPRGRKRKHAHAAAALMNWMAPPIWEQILIAGRAAGSKMSPAAIEHYLKLHNPTQFATITAQVIGRWIERPTDGPARWSDKVLTRSRAAAGYAPGGQNTRSGILVRSILCVFHDLCSDLAI
jgi:hypothetical protein